MNHYKWDQDSDLVKRIYDFLKEDGMLFSIDNLTKEIIIIEPDDEHVEDLEYISSDDIFEDFDENIEIDEDE